MASIQNRNGNFRIRFRFNGEPYARSLSTTNEQKALLAKGQVERNIELVNLGMLTVPDNCDVFNFLLTGRVNNTKKTKSKSKTKKKHGKQSKNVTLEETFKLFFDNFLTSSIEENSLATMRTHRNNLLRVIGQCKCVWKFSVDDVQAFVSKRAKEKGRKGTIEPVTIKKEVTTLFTVLKWAVGKNLVKEMPSKHGIRYPKGKEKQVFQTREEIERKIQLGGLTNPELAELWESLYLNVQQIDEVLNVVKKRAIHPFIYPMFAFAAHTGARRSELMRSKVSDLDFESKMITIRELKRVRGMQSTRRVPMSPFLKIVLEKWMTVHPGGQYTFTIGNMISRSRKTRTLETPLTPDEMHDHFQRTLENTEWEILNGWHTFRHSFCSNCAALGVEERVINEWVGHQTEEMVKRYRHLFPNNQQLAIQAVFGETS